jgi:uncharacterized lipoprotein YajG
MGENKAAELSPPRMRLFFEQIYWRVSMRAPIAIVLASLMLAACGTSHKTVVVAPPAGSTTVVDQNGDAHVIDRDRDR